MITKDNFKDLLIHLGFQKKGNIFTKHFDEHDCDLAVDMKTPELLYPESKGLVINERQTCNFKSDENFVVFECVHRLLAQGYKPESIELEPKWKVGHGASGGRADILVKNRKATPLLIIECKTAGKEFNKAWKDTQEDGGQLFSYIEQEKAVEYVALYASDYDGSSLKPLQKIISHKDNNKILEEQPNLKSFKDAKNVKERFRVWKETYKLEYTEKGLFEENIQPYQIGKEKYSLTIDTKPIDASDKKGKYHQFRTILRKYNVSRRENAFEVLVNLFLCKIVDETENPNDLKFYWKGIAYDNYYDLVDRLQSLYKTGMDKFLKQDIVYISNEDIDNAFWAMKQKRNATKSTIKEIFRQLKFFKGLDFDFIKVHNQMQFEKNAKILLEMIQMWQGLQLLSAGQNQFLGDMFEFFLDNGIKQSEGQFFTPVPICKFIVASLPLETKVINSNEPIKAIDYACGSGHFLNEFALAITPLVKSHKKADVSNYYQNIIGIEKEDRLAKVAKVSAFMYGQDQINIIEQDALNHHEHVKADSFDCLVANPPFAVEDFLLTLDEEVRESFELFETISEIGNKNIQCFFLERAKQLLSPNGVTGIVVPSSILNNSDNTHVRTREILLKYFDIVSIVELGSGTFGKTGTSTVVLFMRRKAHKPTQAEHFANRIKDYFENAEEELKTGGGIYSDLHVLESYCENLEIDFEHYKSLLKGDYNPDLFKHELFSDYQISFESLASTKTFKGSKGFKSKTIEQQNAELIKRLLSWLTSIEKDKLYFFMLAYNNPQKVLIVKSPSDKKEIKSFLGYEWSGAKGSEGIKYSNGDTVYDIQTPLYNPNNPKDDTKINYLISNNFEGKKNIIPNNLKQYISEVDLVDMLNFSQTTFNKEISLSATKKVYFESKYPLAKLGSISSPPQYGANEAAVDAQEGDVRYIRITDINENGTLNEEIKSAENVEEQYKLQHHDLLFARSGNTVGKTFLYEDKYGECIYAGYLIRFRLNSEKVLPVYVKQLTTTESYWSWVEGNITGAGQPNINGQIYSSLKIPVPPKDIQTQIVKECEAVDDSIEIALNTIRESEKKIEELYLSAQQKATDQYRLSNKDNFEISIGKRVLKKEILDDPKKGIPIFSANVFEPFGYIDKELLKDFDSPSILWGIDGDWMVDCLDSQKPFFPTDHCGVIRVKTDNLNSKYVAWALDKAGQDNRFSRSNRASTARIKTMTLTLPSIDIQNETVKEVSKLESTIIKAKKLITDSSPKKQKILDSYLS